MMYKKGEVLSAGKLNQTHRAATKNSVPSVGFRSDTGFLPVGGRRADEPVVNQPEVARSGITTTTFNAASPPVSGGPPIYSSGSVDRFRWDDQNSEWLGPFDETWYHAGVNGPIPSGTHVMARPEEYLDANGNLAYRYVIDWEECD